MSKLHHMFNGVEWNEEKPPETRENEDLPYVTHSGVLEIAGNSLRCFRLSNGMAVIHHDDFHNLFSNLLQQ